MDNLMEKLILAVRERPFLYDTSHSDYMNYLKKTLAWTDISNEIGGECGDAMKEKWKNLRDTYKKHKKCLQMSIKRPGAKKYRNWIWAQHMEFLDGHLRTTDSTLLKDSDNSQLAKRSSTSAQPDIQPSRSAITNVQRSSSPSSSSTQQEDVGKIRRRKRIKDPSDTILHYLKSKKSKQQNLDKIDYLFLNYADTFKGLTPRRQALLKLELAKLFAEAELQNLDELEQDPIDTPTYKYENYP